MRDWKRRLKAGKSLVSHWGKQAGFFVRSSVKRIVPKRAITWSRALMQRVFGKKAVSAMEDILVIDDRRRAFLKYALFGGAVFMAGKYMNPLVNLLRGDTVISEQNFQNFKITETGRQLLVTDDEGDELLIIDKEGF